MYKSFILQSDTIIYQPIRTISYTRSLGRFVPPLLAPAEGSEALRAPRALGALLGAFSPLFITIKLYFESEFPFLGGVCFIKLFDLRPPYICFWFFGTLGGLFWVRFLVFENFEIVVWIRIPFFGGSVLWFFFIWGFLDGFIHSSRIIF